MYQYKTKCTCSQMIYFDLEDGKDRNVQFLDDVIAKLEGTTCGMKKTSCPDQLAQALKEAKANG